MENLSENYSKHFNAFDIVRCSYRYGQLLVKSFKESSVLCCAYNPDTEHFDTEKTLEFSPNALVLDGHLGD